MRNADFRQSPALIVEVIRRVAALVQGEMHLARAEIAQNIGRTRTGLVFFGVAALLALVALNVLAAALVAAIAATAVGPTGAAVIVGSVLLAAAAILVVAGRARLSVAPKRTTQNIRRDVERMTEAFDV